MLTIPNILTLIRIILIPFFVASYYLPYDWSNFIASAIFAFAGVTDALDGYIARTHNQSSKLGEFLDPVADKLLVAAALFIIVQTTPTLWITIPAIVIISREITISALREWMTEIGARAKVKVSLIGKLKTSVQIISILLLLYHEDIYNIPVFEVGLFFFFVATILTLLSMFSYLKSAWPILSETKS